ncbi:chemotaxis protein CheA [Colwellia psychrerythraea]|uniref:Chemotaxis protein CheA n=1 Tax=Colwellia psychrerythraea TaxID=28229 RepID=A0A099KMU0_COLPS|nr:chemotaxis protein CheA [Colwellia psychrerythraea]KGJ91791.1 CheA signal transduction histidine kinase [Colwellia psychrerythraea]
MSLDAVLQTFYIEAQEHLESMENMLLKMDEGECDDEMLNDIFRSAHTIKGSAGIFGLDHIVNFTHVVENVLDRARDNEIDIDKNLIDVIFKCRDHMQSLVAVSLDEYNAQTDLQKTDSDLLAALAPWTSTENKQTVAQNNTPAESQLDNKLTNEGDNENLWHISLRLSTDCLRNGMDPLSFIKFLSSLGEIKHIETIIDNFPQVDNFDAESLYFAYEIALQSDASLEEIENTFMFVQDDSDITILPPTAKIDDYLLLIDKLPEENQRLGDILVNCGSLTRHSLEQALIAQSTVITATGEQTVTPKLGELLTEQNKVSESIVSAALTKQKQNKSQVSEGKQIRIDSNRLDHLINLIGELVINQQRIELLSKGVKKPQLTEAVDDFENFTNQIRDAALSLRMVAIGGTFQRFKRLVRDTAQELGKEVELTIDGADTELDRLMVEKLGDPLTHIVRNAMDHGLESIEDRQAAGKNTKGQLKLAAYHEGGHIVIAISDDGNGINKERIREKAIEKGIINTDSKLSDNELFHLIFHPGFSTAAEVTNLSGRGVGMDVVKRNVEALQGSIDISSQAGKGSEFKIRLPLTLAIIDGFHVEAKGTHFIIPQATIIECINLANHQDIKGRHCINLRGEMIPYLNMSEIFKLTPSREQTLADNIIQHSPKRELVIVQFGSDVAGIAVDTLNGEIQTVVKPLGPIFKALKGIGGSSLLGNGEIAFILDVPQLIELAIANEIASKVSRAESMNGQ